MLSSAPAPGTAVNVQVQCDPGAMSIHQIRTFPTHAGKSRSQRAWAPLSSNRLIGHCMPPNDINLSAAGSPHLSDWAPLPSTRGTSLGFRQRAAQRQVLWSPPQCDWAPLSKTRRTSLGLRGRMPPSPRSFGSRKPPTRTRFRNVTSSPTFDNSVRTCHMQQTPLGPCHKAESLSMDH